MVNMPLFQLLLSVDDMNMNMNMLFMLTKYKKIKIFSLYFSQLKGLYVATSAS